MCTSKTVMVAVFLLLSLAGRTQENEQDSLFGQMLRMDSIIFEEGFNKCNMPALQKAIHNELEFLHDVAGIQNHEQFMVAVKQNICGNKNAKPIRKLTTGSMKVYPLRDKGVLYAAIQSGHHKFYISTPGKPLQATGQALFIHTWFLEKGEWKLKRVLSYDHKAAD